MHLSNLRMNKFLLRYALVLLALAAASSTLGQSRGAATSELIIVTEPKAIVWINDVRYGTTAEDGRFVIKRPPAGRKVIRVRAFGFKESTQTLLPTRSGEVAFTLTKTTDEAVLAFQDAERTTAIDRPKAAELYRKAVSLRANYPEAYVGLARTEGELGNIEAAFAAIKSALRYRPVYPEASAVEGRLLKDTGDTTNAIAAFRRAITQGRGVQPEAFTGLAMLYQERAEEAIANGEIAAAERDYEEAAKNFSSAIKQLGTSPDVGVIVQMLGRIYEHQRKYKEAIALYKEFLDNFPDAVESPAVRSFIIQLEKQLEDN